MGCTQAIEGPLKISNDNCKYLGVQVKTLLVHQRKDKERVEKATEILSRYQKPKEFEESKKEIVRGQNRAMLVIEKTRKAEVVVVLGSFGSVALC